MARPTPRSVDAISAYAYLMGHPELKLAGPPLNPEPYVIAVSVNSPELLRQLEQALAAMQSDGTLSSLKEKWFGPAAAGELIMTDRHWLVCSQAKAMAPALICTLCSSTCSPATSAENWQKPGGKPIMAAFSP